MKPCYCRKFAHVSFVFYRLLRRLTTKLVTFLMYQLVSKFSQKSTSIEYRTVKKNLKTHFIVKPISLLATPYTLRIKKKKSEIRLFVHPIW